MSSIIAIFSFLYVLFTPKYLSIYLKSSSVDSAVGGGAKLAVGTASAINDTSAADGAGVGFGALCYECEDEVVATGE